MAVQGPSQVSLKDCGDPGAWMAANTTPRNSMKDDLGSYRRASLALIPGQEISSTTSIDPWGWC